MEIKGKIKRVTVEEEEGGDLSIKLSLEASVSSGDLQILGDLMKRPICLEITPMQADFLKRFEGNGGPNDGD